MFTETLVDDLVIPTVMPNPALDITYHADGLRPGHEHRVYDVHERPGGKGVDVHVAMRRS